MQMVLAGLFSKKSAIDFDGSFASYEVDDTVYIQIEIQIQILVYFPILLYISVVENGQVSVPRVP